MSLASSIDLLSLWTVLLLGLGLSVAARKMSFYKSPGGVVTPWAVWVAVKTVWTAVFS